MSIIHFGLALSLVAQSANAPPAVRGEDVLVYLCSNLAGTYIAAPRWNVDSDGNSGQDVRITFGGNAAKSSVSWRRNGTEYYAGTGLGLSMSSGFAIVIADADRLETYVYSAGTTELLFSSTRMGNAVLPNSIKAFRGTCVPNANPAK